MADENAYSSITNTAVAKAMTSKGKDNKVLALITLQ